MIFAAAASSSSFVATAATIKLETGGLCRPFDAVSIRSLYSPIIINGIGTQRRRDDTNYQQMQFVQNATRGSSSILTSATRLSRIFFFICTRLTYVFLVVVVVVLLFAECRLFDSHVSFVADSGGFANGATKSNHSYEYYTYFVVVVSTSTEQLVASPSSCIVCVVKILY